MIDIEEIKASGLVIKAKLEERAELLKQVRANDFQLESIPVDLYNSNESIFEQYQDMTLEYVGQEPSLLFNFYLYLQLSSQLNTAYANNIMLNHDDVDMELRPQFAEVMLAAFKEELDFANIVESQLELAVEAVNYFSVEQREDPTMLEARAYFEEKNNLINSLFVEGFQSLTNEIHEKMCKSINEICDLQIRKLDIEFGNIYYGGIPDDEEGKKIKLLSLDSIFDRTQMYHTKHLQLIQTMNNTNQPDLDGGMTPSSYH